MQTHRLISRKPSFKRVLVPCKLGFRHTASILCQDQPKIENECGIITYDKLCQTKVTNFDVKARIDEDIVTLNISMNNTEVMHILEHGCCIPCNSNSLLDT